MIRKYLVRRGRGSRRFAVGMLTNLECWNIYVAGVDVSHRTSEPLFRTRIEIVPL